MSVTLSFNKIKETIAHTEAIKSVCFNNDGTVLASGSMDKTIKLLNIETKEIAILKVHDGSTKSIAFNNNGKILACGSDD